MADDQLKDMRERFDFAKQAWSAIRDQAQIDMRYVSGDPWTAADKAQRKGRPIIAPEEMGQYFNQVINALRANPRGVKFSPVGNGANDRTARFYQNKAREIEYRSHAQIAYMQAAENAIQRSYGYVRVKTDYVSPRSANQEIVIDGFPDPDMVMMDPEIKRPDGSDQQFCFVFAWRPQRELAKQRKAKITDFSPFAASHPNWIQGDKVIEAEYWTVETKARTLQLVTAGDHPLQMFKDEFESMDGAERARLQLQHVRDLRTVQYPTVKQYLTDGIELFSSTEWPGKYIPIVSCFGKVLWVPEDGQTVRKILSMTRFGRDPWKAYCYACCQELEVLGMVPKAPLVMYKGQADAKQYANLQKSTHTPVAALEFNPTTPQTGEQVLPLPVRSEYTQGQYLQAIEVTKEGWRRAIQAAMGSNFLPTQAQRRNEKSGKALDKMEQAATQGTYHFVNSFEDMLRQVGVIEEDLIPHVYSQVGETGIMEADGTARTVRINDPDDHEAYSTLGDHVVTVSTAPSSDSEREVVQEFVTGSLTPQLGQIAELAGPPAAKKIFALGIRMLNMGPLADQVADAIDPPQLGQDGQPVPPQLIAAQGEIQKLHGLLQQAMQERQVEQAKHQADFAKAQMQEQATTERELTLKRMDIAAKIEVARITAAKEAANAELEAQEETIALGVKIAHEAREAEKDRLHEAVLHHRDRVGTMTERLHDSTERAKDRIHERVVAEREHEQAVELADQGVAGQIAVANAQPQPEANA